MNRKKLEELRKIDIASMAEELAAACRETAGPGGLGQENLLLYMAAYALLRLGRDPVGFPRAPLSSAAGGLDLKDELGPLWNTVLGLRDKYDEDSLLALLLFYEPGGKMFPDSTPAGVAQLAARIMDIQPGDYVADFGTGHGAFLRECMAVRSRARYYGNDISSAAVKIASIRAELLGGDIQIAREDILDMEQRNRSFDTVFSHYPFGLRAKDVMGSSSKGYGCLANRPEFARTDSMDWIFSRMIYDTVAGPRRAVCIAARGSTLNTLDRKARIHFLQLGLVEAVIALPRGLFEGSSADAVMIIFSHGNLTTMMVDARSMFTGGRRLNRLSENDISRILEALAEEGEHSKKVGCEEIRRNEYALDPIRYLSGNISVKNGRPFGDVITRITRGAPLKASELDRLVSGSRTDFRYLMPSNIRNGFVRGCLPSLRGIESRLEKYCIPDRSLIISRSGAPYRLAVAEVPEGTTILASGNLFVIELDRDTVNPYYIKAYLESRTGAAVLESISVGTAAPTLGVEQLKTIPVPVPSMEEQNRIAARYLELADRAESLRRELNKTAAEQSSLFNGITDI